MSPSGPSVGGMSVVKVSTHTAHVLLLVSSSWVGVGVASVLAPCQLGRSHSEREVFDWLLWPLVQADDSALPAITWMLYFISIQSFLIGSERRGDLYTACLY